MEQYHKILTAWKRDPAMSYKTLIEGEWATDAFAYLSGLEWLWTEKIHGTNIRIIWAPITFGKPIYMGRADKTQIPPFLLDKLAELFPAETFRKLYPEQPITLYGEGYGARIQKGGGKYIPNGVSFILFDVKVDKWWLKREDTEDVAQKLEIACVPIVGRGTLAEAIDWVFGGFNSFISAETMIAEGLVMRPAVDLFDRSGRRVIAKIKHKDFPR